MIALLCTISLFSCFLTGSSFQQNLVLDGVSLPVDFSSSVGYFPALTAAAAFQTGQFLFNNTPIIMTVVGMNKTDPKALKVFSDVHKNYADNTIKPNLPSDYLYFGNNMNYQNVPYIFKTNSFFMASLRSGPNNTFEIDPFGKSGTTYFSQLMPCLSNTVPRVSAVFDSKMNIISLKVYNGTDPNTELTGYSQEQAATYLLYQGTYFAQCVHGAAHVHHLVMSTAMDYATNNTALNSWARPYMYQIYFKYMQVETIILSKNGFITGSAPASSGFNAVNRTKILEIIKAMLCEWGTFKTADQFVKKFLLANISPKALCGSGIATALLRQVELIGPYANAMEKEFKKDPNYKTIQSNLKSYLLQTGTGVSSISNMRSWLELMSVTGIVHGSTYSMTRLSLTPSLVSINSPDSTTFTARDALLVRVLSVTILGTDEDFYVFSDSLPASYPYGISKVLLSYDKKTTYLKEIYQKEITRDPAVYKTFGWILSDHGPNFMDGKQLTLITYF